MASNNQYVVLEIGGVNADVDPDGKVPTVTYGIEDEDNFENKKSAESFDIELPPTLVNQKIHNTLQNPSVQDKTADQENDNFKPVRYIVGGSEILIGQYLADSADEQNGVPVAYTGKMFGLNGDWVILLKDKTLLDFMNSRSHLFTMGTIVDSWAFDGTNEANDYIYAPARYLKRFGDIPVSSDPAVDGVPADDNVIINDMRPAISIYWLLWRGFKSAGYRIRSTFMDLEYYRRSVLPWTWGAFDFIDDTAWAGLKFLAIENGEYYIVGITSGYPEPTLHPGEGSWTTDGGIKPGAFENTAGIFTWYNSASVLPYMGAWNYPVTPANLNFGHVVANLSIQVSWDIRNTAFGECRFEAHWYKNGVLVQTEVIVDVSSPLDVGFLESFWEGEVDPGDQIGVRIWVNQSGPVITDPAKLTVESFQLNFLKLTSGSTIVLQNYPKLKNFNWLDLLRGEIDFFDLEVQTDPVKKEVYIEPMNDYEIDGVTYPGYFNRNVLDYTQKVDLSKRSKLQLFSDYEKTFDFTFKDDQNDGGLKKIQDRNQVIIGQGRYLLPDRYKVSTNKKENRFYAPTMHYHHDIFKSITGISPQLIAIIPENISNTSAPSAENVYSPKRAYYKGLVSGAGGWKFNGIFYTTLPFMFSVNYNPGGETDPVFSYSDQAINGIIAPGVLKKFFIQRMALYRNGRRYNPLWLKLKNVDIMNFLHRESIVINGMEFFLMNINSYNPIDPDSTSCVLWAFEPAGQVDKDRVYPSRAAIITGGSLTDSNDLKYWPHLLLTSDVSG